MCKSAVLPFRRTGVRLLYPYPLPVTSWTTDAKLYVEALVKKVDSVNGHGVGGIVWPTAGEVQGNFNDAEYAADSEVRMRYTGLLK